MSRRLRVLDLCAGTCGFSAGFIERGDIVTAVEIDPPAELPGGVELLKRDVREVSIMELGAFDVTLGGPPCPEFSGMRHANPRLRGVPPSQKAFDVVEACFRLARDSQARFWAIENVRGAIKWWSPIYGEPTHRLGAWYLWAALPPTRFPEMPMKLGSRAISRAGRGRVNDLNKQGRERSRTPHELADALAQGVHDWYARRPFPKPAIAQAELRDENDMTAADRERLRAALASGREGGVEPVAL